MSLPTSGSDNRADAALAEKLARLWPHRSHESNWLKNLFCCAGLHRWARLDLDGLVPQRKQVRFCRWCSKTEVGGVLYGD